jgi:phosphomevalonate kinase
MNTRPIFARMPTRFVVRPLLVGLLLALSTSTHAEIYKWVDADGSVHYSDIKPNNKDAARIKTKTGSAEASAASSTPDASETSPSDPQSQAKALDEQKKTEQDVADRQAEMDKAKAELDEKCAAIRDNLKKIEENSRIRIEDNGQVRFLSAEEIIEKKQNFQKMLDESCKE